MSVWPWILLEREISWSWIPRTRSVQCHSHPVLVTPRKPPDPVKYIYYSNTYDLRTRMDIWRRMDVVPVEHGTLSQKFHLTMWFFHFITRINFRWDYVLWSIIDLLMWIGIWTKLIIHRVPSDPVRWSFRGFGSL